jgi:hypothetical protein
VRILPVGAEFFSAKADRQAGRQMNKQTGRHDKKLIVAFPNFANAPKSGIQFVIRKHVYRLHYVVISKINARTIHYPSFGNCGRILLFSFIQIYHFASKKETFLLLDLSSAKEVFPSYRQKSSPVIVHDTICIR